MPKPIAIEAVIIGSVHLCRSEKSERKRNAGIAQVIYLATLIGQSKSCVYYNVYSQKCTVHTSVSSYTIQKCGNNKKLLIKFPESKCQNRDWSEVKSICKHFCNSAAEVARTIVPVFCLIFEEFKAVACNFIIA